MRKPGFYPLAWGIFLLVSSALLWGFAYGLPAAGGGCSSATCVAVRPLAPALLSTAGVVSALIGLGLMLRRTEGIDRARRAVVDQSMATAVLAAGLAMLVLGGAVGRWMDWIGIGVVALGIGGVVRETLALRELRRRDAEP